MIGIVCERLSEDRPLATVNASIKFHDCIVPAKAICRIFLAGVNNGCLGASTRIRRTWKGLLAGAGLLRT